MTKTQEKIITELESLKGLMQEEIEHYQELSKKREGKEEFYQGIEKGLMQAIRVIEGKIKDIRLY